MTTIDDLEAMPAGVAFGRIIGNVSQFVGDVPFDSDTLPDRLPLPAKITFAPNVAYVVHEPTGDIIFQTTIVADVQRDGSFVIDLVATDNESLNPTRWAYDVTITPTGATPLRARIAVPGGTTQTLGKLIGAAQPGVAVVKVEGPAGPPPTITWDGTTMLVNGKPGPDLKGENLEVSGKAWGPVSGAITLAADKGVQSFSATGPLVVSLPEAALPFAFVTVFCEAGGTNVAWPDTGSAARPYGDPVGADFMIVSFQRLLDHWVMLPAGAGGGSAPEPDTTPPSQPGVKIASVTDTALTLAVTRGVDEESKPTLMGRYYVQGAASKPDFAPVSLDGTSWLIDGLTQNTPYVIEAQEVSKGGTSAARVLAVTTARTKGWVVASSATFDAPDGTDPATLKMSDGQAITVSGNGGEKPVIVGNAVQIISKSGSNGTAMLTLPASSTLSPGRVRAAYRFAPGSGRDTALRLYLKGGYPLGSVILKVAADGNLSLDTSGSNATWTAPVWTGPASGYPTSGTISLSVDATNKTVYVWSNGQQICSTTASQAIPGLNASAIALDLWSGGGISVDQVDIMSYQA